MVDGQVLVLNKSWVAVHIASVRRAFGMLYQDLARVVHPDDYSLYDFDDWCQLSRFFESGQFVRTVSLRIRVPEVIILDSFNGFFMREVRFSRRNIFARDKNTCQYCGKKPPRPDLTIDHVVPRSRGGRDTWQNVVLACIRCNIKKRNRTPGEARMPLLHEPVKPTWLPQLGPRIPYGQIHSWQRFVDTAYWNVELSED